MKKARKALLTLCAALLLVSVTAGITVAYLTDTESVKNTFTVGNVAIDLDELDVDKDDNTADNVTYGEGEDAKVRDKANKYHLLPGETYVKDPTIHVSADSENAYLFVQITNGLKDIEGATTIHDQMLNKGWILKDGTNGIYAYKDIVAKSTDVIIFEQFTIDGNVSNETLATYANKTIEVIAYAIQAEGFDTVDKAMAEVAWVK